MRIIARPALIAFWTRFPDAREPLEAWYHLVLRRSFVSPHDVKELFRSASILKDGIVVFNIGGNKYRLVVHIRYDLGIVFIKEVMTHPEYDDWTAARKK